RSTSSASACSRPRPLGGTCSSTPSATSTSRSGSWCGPASRSCSRSSPPTSSGMPCATLSTRDSDGGRPVTTHADTLRELSRELSNWGRWGPDDELGTLNLITPEVRKRALAAVRHGVTVGCARPIVFEGAATDAPRQPLHYMYATGETPGAPGAADFLGVV